MSHYDNSREGYCPACGAAPGNIINGVCEFCSKQRRSSPAFSKLGGPDSPKTPKPERQKWSPPKALPPAPVILRPVMREDKVIEILRGDPAAPKKAVSAKHKIDVHIFKNGDFSVQVGGREVKVGSGGREVAESFVQGFRAAASAKYKVTYFQEA